MDLPWLRARRSLPAKGETQDDTSSYLHTDPVIASSYLFGCGGTALGAVVDPVAAPEQYLADAEAVRLRVAYVIDTHVHADHVIR